MSQDTNVSNLIINTLTRQQYEGIGTPSPTELYIVTDDTGITSTDVITALGYTPESTSNKVTSISSSSTDIEYPSAKLVYDQLATKQASLGYTAENSANKVTSISSSSTDTEYPSAKLVYDQLATKQATLVSGTNIKTINSTTLLGSGNINVLQNTATGTNSLTIGGTATSSNYSLNIGSGSSATYNYGTAVGYNAGVSNTYATSLGYNAKTSALYSIQLGYGTNSTASTLSVGFYNSNSSLRLNWSLLDGTTGLIPDARLSSNIARTSAITNMQTTTNLVTSVSSSSTDSQYPSAKLFYDTVGNLETLLAAI